MAEYLRRYFLYFAASLVCWFVVAVSIGIGFYLADGAGVAHRWVYIGLGVTWIIASAAIVLIQDPQLMYGQRKPVEEQDRPFRLLFFPLAIGVLLIACLDVGRIHLIGQMPPVLQGIGLVLDLGGLGIYTWASIANPAFAPLSRLKVEQDQPVVSGGPYRYVRHPAYLGGILIFLGSGLLVGSWIGTILFCLWVPYLWYRTEWEDRQLREGVKGYRRYTEKVRYRLVPRLW